MDHNGRYNLAGTYQALEDLGLTKEAFLFNAAKGLFGAVASPLSKVLGRVGQSGLRLVGETGLPTKTLGTLTRGASRDAASGALLMGGAQAAMADPGERWNAFLRGAAAGGLGGAAYRVGSRAMQMGTGKLLGARGMGELTRAANIPRAGQRVIDRFGTGTFGGFRQGFGPGMKQLGANALLRGAPFAAGIGASMLAPTFEEDPQRQQNVQTMRMMQPLVS